MWSHCTLLVAVSIWATAVPSTAELLELLLLHTNDMHSRFDETNAYCNECSEQDVAQNKCYGGFARVAKVVKQEKAKAKEQNLPSLFVVAGDTYQGTPYFTFFKWKPVVDFIDQLKPDVTNLGNHEFDGGVQALMPYLNGTMSIPVVVSNMDLTKEPELKKYIRTSYVLTLNGTKVGFVGYLTPDTTFLAQTDGVKLLDEIESLKKETKNLRDQGVNIIIALGHSGIIRDVKIAEQVGDIDLIVGGHSHTFLYTGENPDIDKVRGPYPLFVNSTNGKVIPVLHAYANTKYLGKVNVCFDAEGNVLNIKGSPILLDHTIQKDEEMEAIVQRWKAKVVRHTSEIVGNTIVQLHNKCRYSECNIGNFIADAFVFYNIRYNKPNNDTQWTDAPIAIVVSGSIRSSIKETGDISMGQLVTIMPFMSKLSKLTIPGNSVLQAFENSVFGYNADRGSIRFLQVSGALVEYDLSKPPGHRVVRLLLRCQKCLVPILEPVDIKANYTLIMTTYIARGGDTFDSFKNGPRKIQDLDIEDIQATIEYMKIMNPVYAGVENRIIVNNAPNHPTSVSDIGNCPTNVEHDTEPSKIDMNPPLNKEPLDKQPPEKIPT